MSQFNVPNPENRSVIIEFVGLPGSGKSLISHLLAEKFRSKGLSVTEHTYNHDHQNTMFRRKLIKLRMVLGAIVKRPLWCLKISFGMITNTSGVSIAVCLNYLYISNLIERLSSVPGIHIFDQGIFQAIWSVLYRSRKGSIPKLTKIFAKYLPATINLSKWHLYYTIIKVDADISLICERLKSRNRKVSKIERQYNDGQLAEALTATLSLLDKTILIANNLQQRSDCQNLIIEVLGNNKIEEASVQLECCIQRCIRLVTKK